MRFFGEAARKPSAVLSCAGAASRATRRSDSASKLREASWMTGAVVSTVNCLRLQPAPSDEASAASEAIASGRFVRRYHAAALSAERQPPAHGEPGGGE